jgi:hypothetical protein
MPSTSRLVRSTLVWGTTACWVILPAAAVFLLVSSVPQPGFAGPATPVQDPPGSAQLRDVLSELAKFDMNGRLATQKIGFEMPERAVNDYLVFAVRTRPRPGFSAASVTLLPDNDVSADLTVDIDAVREWDPAAFPDALRPLLGGKRTVRLLGRFDSSGGTATVTVKDAQSSDGKSFGQKAAAWLVGVLGQHQPEAVDITKPIPLPFGLKRVWTRKQVLCGET